MGKSKISFRFRVSNETTFGSCRNFVLIMFFLWDVEGIYRNTSRLKNARRPVSRVLSPTSHEGRKGDGHSSGTPVAGRLARPTRAATRKRARGPKPACRPYSVLLPVGFTMPFPSPGTRCALTAPFHPYPASRRSASPGGLLSVALSLGSPPPGVTRHRVSVEPGLSSPRSRKNGERPSDRLASVEGGGPGSRRQARRQANRRHRSSSRATVSASAMPSTRPGRKWRWNAATAWVSASAPRTR